MLAIFKKLKDMFRKPESHVGSVSITFLNQEKGRVFTQEIWGITVYEDREKMIDYLNRTIMTTMTSDICILDYVEVNK